MFQVIEVKRKSRLLEGSHDLVVATNAILLSDVNSIVTDFANTKLITDLVVSVEPFWEVFHLENGTNNKQIP
jgi:hypothetical protein